MNVLSDSAPLTRRRFVGLAVAGAGTLAAVGSGGVLTGRALAAKPGGSATRYRLRIPQTVSPTGLALTVAPATADMGDGKARTVWAYNGQFPGPTLTARPGDKVSIDLVNGLQQESITHWHGMLVDTANDGGPQLAVGPGITYPYSYTVHAAQRAALNWYHPHPHMLTGEQVARGLAGAYVIRDAEEDALGLPSGSHELPLIVRDASFERNGDMKYVSKNGGFLGTTPLVNGTLSPYLDVDRATYRFRVLGGANARIFRLALANGMPFTLIGNDGGLLAAPASLAWADVAPGERLDVLVDFSGLTEGTNVMLRDQRAGWDLLEFRVGSVTGPSYTPPTTLSTITPLADPVRERFFSFDGMSKINGTSYTHGSIDFEVPFGEVELWRFKTNGNAPHPVHVHGASFQVVSRTGGRGGLFPWEAGWKDTVLLEDAETIEVLIRFDAYRGEYVMHCHKLEHEDMGMMSGFRVV